MLLTCMHYTQLVYLLMQWLNCPATGGGSLFLILVYTVRCS